MKKKFSIFALTALSFLLPLTACSSEKETTKPTEQQQQSPYKIVLTAIGQTTIKVSKTLQLRSSVTGTTQKDVNWSSSDEKLASVSSTGVVKALKEGEVTITATLKIDANCKASIKIKIEPSLAPTSLTITGVNADSSVQWVGEELQLGVQTDPKESSSLVSWKSSDNEVASVDENGKVTFLKAGPVEITATSLEDENVKVSVNYNVKYGYFRSDLGSPYWNLDHQADDNNPNITLGEDTPNGYHSAYFSHVLSTKYYVEFNFKITKQLSAWVWQGVGLGSGLSETDTRYFLFSPRVDGQGNNFNKTIVKDLPNESWPAITTRSQVWGENGLNYINWDNNKVKLAMIRNGNEHYWLINDKVMWYDYSTKYEDVATMPILCGIDVACTISDYKVETDSAKIDAMLNKNDFKKSFFACNQDIITYKDDSSFSFDSNTVLCKDNKVRSIGDKAKLVGDFNVEFDVSDMMINKGHTNGFTGITMSLSRYDQADTCESFLIGKSAVQSDNTSIVSRYVSWNYQLSMDDDRAPYSYLETSVASLTNEENKHHIKITRTIKDNIASFQMFVDGKECVFDVKSSKNVTATSRYTGAYLIWVGGEYTSGSISNFTFTSGLNS